jgi:hypothetical protein
MEHYSHQTLTAVESARETLETAFQQEKTKKNLSGERNLSSS